MYMLLFNVATANWKSNKITVSALIVVRLEAMLDLPQCMLLEVNVQGQPGS